MRARKISAFLLVIFISFSACYQKVYAEESYTVNNSTKFISLVYDDSSITSENGNTSWSKINFACQSIASMIRPGDSLYVTTFETPHKTDVSKPENFTALYKTIKGISTYYRSSSFGSTEALDTAFSKLTTLSAQNPTAEYWLVVLCDSKIRDQNRNILSGSQLSDKFYGYRTPSMPNGSKVNILYMALGENAETVKSNEEQGLYSVSYDNKSFTQQLDEISELFTGRLNSKDFKFADVICEGTNKVTVESDVALYDMAVITNSSAVLENVTFNGKTDIPIPQNMQISYPKSASDAIVADTSLSSDIAFIGNHSQILKPGTYTLTFSENIYEDNINIFIQPDIKISRTVRLSENGKDILENTELYADEKIDVLYFLSDSAGEPINTDALSLPVSFSVNTVSQGTSSEANTDKIKNFSLALGENTFIANAKIGPFPVYSDILKFSVNSKFNYKLVCEKVPEKISAESLSKGSDPILLGIRSDSTDLKYTRQDLSRLDISFDISPNDYLKLDTLIHEDGTVSLVPRSCGDPIKSEFLLRFSAPKDIKISVNINDVPVGLLEIPVEPAGQMSKISFFALPLIVLIVIIGYIFKPRFSLNYKIYRNTGTQKDGCLFFNYNNWYQTDLAKFEVIPYPCGISSFFPFIGNRKKSENIVIAARGILHKNRKLKIKSSPSVKNTYIIKNSSSINQYYFVELKPEKIDFIKAENGKFTDIEYTDAVITESDGKYTIYKFDV